MRITRNQLRRIIKEELELYEFLGRKRKATQEPEDEEGNLEDFWPHGEDEVVEEDGKLKALGSHSPASPVQTALTQSTADGRAKLSKHKGSQTISGARRSASEQIGDTLYSIIEMPA